MTNIKDDKERKYYNRKLLKSEIKSELKKPYKNDWLDYISGMIGIFLSLILIDVIGTEQMISSEIVRFVIEVIIIAVSILSIQAVARGLRKLITKLKFEEDK